MDKIQQAKFTNIKLLLEYLLDPTKEKDDAYCVSCDRLLVAKKEGTNLNSNDLMGAFKGIQKKSELVKGSPDTWDELKKEVDELKSPEISELLKKAEQKMIENCWNEN
jgi:hypothetical protein